MNIVHYPGPAQNQAEARGEIPQVGSNIGLGYAVGSPGPLGEICGDDPATILEPGLNVLEPGTKKIGTSG